MSVAILLTGCSPSSRPSVPTAPSRSLVLLTVGDDGEDSGWRPDANHQCLFRIVNNSSQSIQIPGYFEDPPINGLFYPNFVMYEVETDNTWNKLDVAYDGISEDYTLQSGNEWRLPIDVSPFQIAGVSNTARLRIIVGTIVSEPFTLGETTGSGEDMGRKTGQAN